MERRSSSTRFIARDISDGLGMLPPQALDLEESILGAIILQKGALESVIDTLRMEHFYSDQHKEIFGGIMDLHRASKPVDMRLLVAQLRKNGKLELVGGAYYIAELTSKVSSSANIEHHVKVIIEMAIKRELIQIASQIHHEAYEDTTDAFDLLEKSEESIRFISEGKIKGRVKKSNLIELDLKVALGEHGEYVQSGETCRIDALKDVFAWMPGFVSAYYGWSNDGKGTGTDYLMMVKSIRDDWKWGLYKQEDMDTVVTDGKVKIKANRIYLNLAWTYTGKTWNKKFAEKHNCEMMTLDELKEALDFVSKHFFVIYPDDRRLEFILKDFRHIFDLYGCEGFMLDPWNTVKLDESKRGDHQLVDAFIDVKEFAMLTNSCFGIINHPKSLHEVKDKDGKYKIVNQFMQLGGSAWDIKMDSQYSFYRQERHLDPRSMKTSFLNLKQRQAEIVGVNKGEFTGMEFDFKKRRYYFDSVDVISGELQSGLQKQSSLFSQTQRTETSDLPF